jgi:biotin transport system substrate-specific component
MEAIIKRELISNKKFCRLLAVAACVILTALSAFVRIPLPFTPVPLTLQTFFVLLGAALLGRKLGVITQSAYMFLGLTGQQVFTGVGCGSLYLLGPTGGYIAGFILAAIFAGGLMAQEKISAVSVFLRLLTADCIILFSGTLWLKISIGSTLGKAFLLGFFPFLLGDVFKVVLATAFYIKMRSRIKAALY